MRDDHTAACYLRRDFRQDRGDVLVRQAMKTISLETGLAEIARQLARCELTVRRLRSVELASLYHACWCPELARVQRLRRELAEFTTLIVQADDRTERRG